MAIKAALSQLGVRYRWGASSPGVAFDCSGLTQWAWGKAGVSIPRVSRSQYAALRR
ncbi:MAG: NlpC/P60 family protein, partial [Actinomycetota bacterium]|nr:NlpC/P60 family protein [Actinomycetota bacterium]